MDRKVDWSEIYLIISSAVLAIKPMSKILLSRSRLGAGLEGRDVPRIGAPNVAAGYSFKELHGTKLYTAHHILLTPLFFFPIFLQYQSRGSQSRGSSGMKLRTLMGLLARDVIDARGEWLLFTDQSIKRTVIARWPEMWALHCGVSDFNWKWGVSDYSLESSLVKALCEWWSWCPYVWARDAMLSDFPKQAMGAIDVT